MRIELTVTLVAISGTLLAWFGSNFLFGPIRDINAAVRGAFEDRVYFSNRYWSMGTSDTQGAVQGSEALRRHAARLESFRLRRIPFRKLWEVCGWIPTDKDLLEMKKALIGLSNSFGAPPTGMQATHVIDAIRSFEETVDRVARRRGPESKGASS